MTIEFLNILFEYFGEHIHFITIDGGEFYFSDSKVIGYDEADFEYDASEPTDLQFYKLVLDVTPFGETKKKVRVVYVNQYIINDDEVVIALFNNGYDNGHIITLMIDKDQYLKLKLANT